MTGAGSLRDFVTLEARSQAPTGATGMATSYIEVDRCWAEIRGVRYGQFVDAVQTEDASTHTIRMRWRQRYGFDYISADGERRFRVNGIRDPDNKRRWLDVFCTEMQPEPAQ